jgi:hypothetical protein
MRAQIDFCEVEKDVEGGYQIIEKSFFLFCQKKIKDRKARWQTVEDALNPTS